MRKLKAFTLVELLVVIGIIALLISILLPSLTRARSSAQLLACQSNFRQVYQAILFYSNENKGLLPLASVSKGWDTGNPANAEFAADTSGTNAYTFIVLNKYLGSTIKDLNTNRLSPVFTCTEALDSSNGTIWNANSIRTVKLNPRAFPGYDAINQNMGFAPVEYPQRKLGSIKDSSGKVAFWDGPQLPNWNLTTEPEAIFTEGWRWNWGHMVSDPATNSYDQGRLDNPTAIDCGQNKDDGWWVCSVRYRHMRSAQSPQGSTTPVAFFDGHVESRKKNNNTDRKSVV